ncbi:hypothetical protein JOF41_000042 [Saccharothrix coeruleofusca]|uniref:hypothetical protein n=1 Tax=Saccharothrix coeruleofusca TaxID=33919 RepID=UPI001FD26FD0|nr:hypothetical protein [Saccharothrix coeruleofusca]MBP2333864.1 hypothetical protein [Saccharothrix coeruleofusca]
MTGGSAVERMTAPEVVRAVAREAPPRRFAIVEEYGDGEDARVAGYGLAYDDHAQVNSVEGDFPLKSRNAETARAVFELSSNWTGARRVHLVWLDR